MFRITVYLIIALVGSYAEAKSLRAIISETNTPPFIIQNDSAGKAGLVIDVTTEVAKQLQWDIEFITIPRARAEQWMQTDKADIWCFTSPSWVNQPWNMVWSDPLYKTVDLLIRNAASAPFKQMRDLEQTIVGTSRGFHYPKMKQLFLNGHAIRDDAVSLKENLQRLQLGWVDVVIADDFSFNHYVNTNKNAKEIFALKADQIWPDTQPSYCAVNNADKARSDAILKVLANIHRNNMIDSWVKTYF